jgi:hypothetical protein
VRTGANRTGVVVARTVEKAVMMVAERTRDDMHADEAELKKRP